MTGFQDDFFQFCTPFYLMVYSYFKLSELGVVSDIQEYNT